MLNENQVTVISGETGCGKTTQVRGNATRKDLYTWWTFLASSGFPQRLKNLEIESGHGKVMEMSWNMKNAFCD